ncbi:MAG TPA: hypothetical protein VNZ63_07700 [Verrucomicrobiae bacterium]|jgi:hypothetical protein|nr:hypothetical protein [Verrucomicrobiae bacterium]
MDSRDKGESKLDRRREALAGRIGEALDAMDSHNAGDCPDGEILAAYAERGLALEETAKWEGHFATCSRCRKILLVLDASAATPLAEKEVAGIGEPAALTLAPPRRARPVSEGGPRWLADWRVRWLAPALGVAAVVVLLVLRPPWREAQRPASETLVAQAPKEELPLPPVPAGEDRFSRVAPSQQLMPQTAPRPERSSSSEPAPLNSPAASLAKGGAEAGAAVDKTLSPEAGKKKFNDQRDTIELQAPSSSSASSSNTPASQAAMPSPAVPPPPAKPARNMAAGEAAQLDAGANSVAGSASREKQAVTAPGAPAPNAAAGVPIPQISSEARLNERKVQEFALIRPLQKESAVLKAPSGSTLWRIGMSGSVERSTDAGKVWVLQATPSPDGWLAGAAVSDTICWLVGRRGAIARTLDGGHWESVTPPSQAAGLNAAMPDWVGVTAADTQTATITAGDGRKFATADGGKTWQQQTQK